VDEGALGRGLRTRLLRCGRDDDPDQYVVLREGVLLSCKHFGDVVLGCEARPLEDQRGIVDVDQKCETRCSVMLAGFVRSCILRM